MTSSRQGSHFLAAIGGEGGTVHRCSWPGQDPLYCAYHDTEWGVPERDSRALWEKLVLDGFQAGLSWITILRKREAFRRAFEGFDPDRVARFGEAEIAALLSDPGIVRSRAKIVATVGNARAFVAMRDRGEDFSSFVWGFASDEASQEARRDKTEVPTETAASRDLSKALKARGYKFVGPVIVYAWMQAVGLVNDHVVQCFRYAELRSDAAET